MKKIILMFFLVTSTLSQAQTKDLQLSIDSFRTALNEQNTRVKHLESMVHNLYQILGTVKYDSLACNTPDHQKGSNCCMQHNKMTTSEERTSSGTHKNTIKSKERAKTTLVENSLQNGPKGGRYYRTAHGRKYYITANGRKYFVAPNGRIVYVTRI